MIKIRVIVSIIIITQSPCLYAWYCKDVASERLNKNTINACGIGTASTEAKARDLAFSNSKREFSRVCGVSDYCKNRNWDILPQRADCQKQKNGKYKCYRLLQFKIGKINTEKKLTNKAIQQLRVQKEQKKLEAKIQVTEEKIEGVCNRGKIGELITKITRVGNCALVSKRHLLKIRKLTINNMKLKKIGLRMPSKTLYLCKN